MPDQQIDRRVYNIEDDIRIIKKVIYRHSEQNDLILSALNDLKINQEKQRGFFAGVEKAGAAFIAMITAVAAMIAFFFDHIFGKHA